MYLIVFKRMGIKDIIFFEDSKIGSPTKDIYICIYITVSSKIFKRKLSKKPIFNELMAT